MHKLQRHFAILENHYYGSDGVAIKYKTRNVCADATGKILEEMAHILFPSIDIEIYVLPAEKGCHLDKFWIKTKENPLATGLLITFFGAVLVLPSHISQIATDSSTRKLNKLQIEELKKRIDKEAPGVNITIEQYEEIINNKEIRSNRNKHFKQLQDDTDIKREKFVAISNDEILSEKTINDTDFERYIEPIIIEEARITIKASGLIEILGPIVKQKKEGGGIKWKGIYHGKDIFYKDRVVIAKNTSIDFYMQDDDFKEKISNHEIVFREGDNMFVQMEISFFLSDSQFNRKNIYIKNVERFNKDTIEHKFKKMSHDTNLKNQASLFEKDI